MKDTTQNRLSQITQNPDLHAEGLRFPLKPGERVQNYLIEAAIAGGGFSIVYRCFDPDTHHNVILKEYFPNQLAMRDDNNHIHPVDEKHAKGFSIGLSQFFSEAMTLSKINHPHVVKVLDVFRANNTAYMAYRLQAGKDLKWFIRNCHGDLDGAFLGKIIPPIISGLHAFHQCGFLHLDVKPANILLRAEGGVLLLDFGAAKSIDRASRFTSFQTLTPGYAPPEQHRRQGLAPASDVYALAATIYACITGRTPPTSPVREKQGGELKLYDSEKKIDAEMLEAMQWALRLDIAERPQTMPEFGDKFLQNTKYGSFANFEKSLTDPGDRADGGG